MENLGTPKSFWSRPEGKTGMLFLSAGGIAAAVGLYKVLPFLITLLENTLYTALLGAALVAITSPIWNPQIRTLLSYGFKGVMRTLTGAFIKIDPISILKGYIDTLAERLAKVDEQIGALNGQIKRIQISIAENAEEIAQGLRKAKIAKEQGNNLQMAVEAKQAGRLEASNKKLSELLAKMQGLYKMLLKLREVSAMTKLDIENEVEHREREYKSIQASHSALKSAMSIIKGGGAEKALYDQTMEYLAENYATKMGEIETAMTLSEGFIASVDLDNAAFQQEAMEKLEAMAAGSLFEKAGAKVEVQESAVHSIYR